MKLEPFWNREYQHLSNNTWLKGTTEGEYLNGSFPESNGWFRIDKLESNLSSIEDVEKVNGEDSIRYQIIRLYPTSSQRNILKQWMGMYRWVYNKSVEMIENKESTLKELYKKVRDKWNYHITQPEWSNGLKVPVHILDKAIKTCRENYIRGFKALKRKHIKHFKLRYKTRKDLTQSLVLDIHAFPKKKSNTFYPTFLGSHIDSQIPFKDIPKKESRLVWNIVLDTWDLLLPIEYEGESQTPTYKEIALDPGNRTFLTGYSPQGHYIEIGKKALVRIEKHNKEMGIIKGIMSKSNHHRKKSLRKALFRKSIKIQNLRKDLHWKSANYLTRNYSRISIGNISTSKISEKAYRGINRGLYSLAHFEFRQKLLYKSKTRGVECLVVDESYTSKTCGKCGSLNQIGSLEEWECYRCNHYTYRDYNAARNIWMKSKISQEDN